MQSTDGSTQELSIVEALSRSREFSRIVGEVPTMTFALARLLLAVLQRATGGPRTTDEWIALWHAGPPVDAIEAYTGHWRDRFDLFHPVAPFFQVADLHTKNNDITGLERLIAEVPNGAQFFTTRSGDGVNRLQPAEAARWLVHCQAYDPSGIKSGAEGDSRVKGGKGFPIGVGWSGLLGGVLLEGRDFWETMLLNTIPLDSDLVLRTGVDLPPWERDQLTAAADGIAKSGTPDQRLPQGPIDLSTWQSRRIKLFRDGDSSTVTGVLISNGDKQTPQLKRRYEPMTAWRRSEPQSKKYKELIYMPLEHDPARALWRSIEALLPNVSSSRQTSEGAERMAPPTIEWSIEALEELGGMENYAVRTHAIGIAYGPQSSVISEIVDDQLDLATGLLREASAPLAAEIVEASRVGEAGVRSFGYLGKNLDIASGARGLDAGDGARERAKEIGYDAIGRDFQAWLGELAPTTSVPDARHDWHRRARATFLRIGDELVESVGELALVGGEMGGRHYDAGLSQVWFRAAISKLFTAATPPGASPNPSSNASSDSNVDPSIEMKGSVDE